MTTRAPPVRYHQRFFRHTDMIISRNVYLAALAIGKCATQYNPQDPDHSIALEAGVARLQGGNIELTHKGEEVIRLE